MYTADDGSYVCTGVPAGETTVTVNYTGYEPGSVQLNVSGGAKATRDFDLKGAVYQPGKAADGSVVKLDQFVVSSEREGNAKAIMEQRASLNFKSVVASDSRSGSRHCPRRNHRRSPTRRIRRTADELSSLDETLESPP
ncbi:MAG: carboxypeptidase-like regulatory domain-containing protein, partial [Opitutaceae bacterium]